MPDEPEWMPVFALIERRGSGMQAAHPDHKQPLPDNASRVEDVVHRIGTARRDADGSYVVTLTALPINGQLLLRPPRSGEYPEVTQKDRR
jgi:hypothetical protein